MEAQLESDALEDRAIQVSPRVATVPPNDCAPGKRIPVGGLRGIPVRQSEQTLGSDRQLGGCGLQFGSRNAVGSALTELLPAPRGNIRGRVEDGFQSIGLRPEPGAVSYTHLRAHETGRNLVCRLL